MSVLWEEPPFRYRSVRTLGIRITVAIAVGHGRVARVIGRRIAVVVAGVVAGGLHAVVHRRVAVLRGLVVDGRRNIVIRRLRRHGLRHRDAWVGGGYAGIARQDATWVTAGI